MLVVSGHRGKRFQNAEAGGLTKATLKRFKELGKSTGGHQQARLEKDTKDLLLVSLSLYSLSAGAVTTTPKRSQCSSNISDELHVLKYSCPHQY